MDQPELSPRRLAAYSTLTALSVLSSSAIGVALPEVSLELGLREAGAGWVLAAFSIAFPIGAVSFGRVIDAYGQRLAWRWGSAMFVGGSLLAAVAPALPLLLTGRLVQGLGAGAIPTLTLARISSSEDAVRRTGRVGIITAVVSMTAGIGPLLGGSLATFLHWRVVFALPIVALLFSRIVSRDLRHRTVSAGRLDLAGGILTLTTLGMVLIAIRGLVDPGAITFALPAGLLGGVTGTVLTLRIRRQPECFLRREILTDRRLLVSGFAGLAMLTCHMGAVFAIPLILAADRGWTAFQIGLAMLPAALLGVSGATIAPRFQYRFGARTTAVVAAGCSLAGVNLVAIGSTALPSLVGGLALASVGGLGGQVVHTTRVLRRPDDPLASSAMGVFQLLLFSGAAVGPVIVGAVAQAFSFRAGLLALLPFPLLAALLSITMQDDPGTR